MVDSSLEMQSVVLVVVEWILSTSNEARMSCLTAYCGLLWNFMVVGVASFWIFFGFRVADMADVKAVRYCV